ncbi:MAG: exodeoxyribonuclease VII large subunit [Eubacteriaceae bacterium]|nr:exodeoxyribonuclease VII large subunit [Eubacteriaceae bacterium]
MQTYTVSDLTSKINGIITTNPSLNAVAVEGEVSNFNLNASGHLYFSLKDENSKINCVMFRKDVMNIDFIPKDGMYITVYGRVGFYEKTSACQIYVTVLINSGQGALWAKFTELKEKLEAKGYFSAEHKKPIPVFPKKIAVVTSPTGAVIHDIVKILRRRNPAVEIILCPSAVQGRGAETELANAVKYVNAHNIADVIILARGGGSIEELWAFNEPALADAIYNSKIPVISAVGHETDFTISDFVSDLRAATPSAAAEIVAIALADIKSYIFEKEKYINSYVINLIYEYRKKLESIKNSAAITKTPQKLIDKYRQSIISLDRRMKLSTANKLHINKIKLDNLKIRLANNEVEKTLNKGYAIAYKNNKLISNIGNVALDDNIELKFAGFNLGAKVTDIKGENNGKG